MALYNVGCMGREGITGFSDTDLVVVCVFLAVVVLLGVTLEATVTGASPEN